MQKTREIIFQVGQEMGLTKEESLQLWDQYWVEYVLRNMYLTEHISIVIQGLGSFFTKQKRLEKTIVAIKKLADDPRFIDGSPYKDLIKKRENLLEAIIERNTKFKRKRIYG